MLTRIPPAEVRQGGAAYALEQFHRRARAVNGACITATHATAWGILFLAGSMLHCMGAARELLFLGAMLALGSACVAALFLTVLLFWRARK